jgi:hypothetical protein
MFKRTVLIGLLCVVCSAAQATPGNYQKAACTVTITPAPVVVNTAWYVLVSGFKPGETDIVLGNGWNDGNYMYQRVFTADANGNIGVAPPLFEYQTIGGQTLDPTGTHNFQVLHVNLTSGAWKLLCDESYEVVAQ